MALATGSAKVLVEAQKQLQLGVSAGQDKSASVGHPLVHYMKGRGSLAYHTYEVPGLVSCRQVGLQLP